MGWFRGENRRKISGIAPSGSLPRKSVVLAESEMCKPHFPGFHLQPKFKMFIDVDLELVAFIMFSIRIIGPCGIEKYPRKWGIAIPTSLMWVEFGSE